MKRVEIRRFQTYADAKTAKNKLNAEQPDRVIQIRRKSDGFHVVERIDG